MEIDQNPLFPEDFSAAPLAERVRPTSVDEFVGQEHLLGPGKLLRRSIERGEIFSVIFWGPPGTGKTTLARIIARAVKCRFVPFSAVTSGIKEIKAVMDEAEIEWRAENRRTVLFIDEIHRFNKAQQDAFLPFIERGSIVLVGATTENPSFEVTSALLSRIKVLILNPLTEQHLRMIIDRALVSPHGLKALEVSFEPAAIHLLTAFANGDARIALNALELAAGMIGKSPETGKRMISQELLTTVLQKKALLYDKNGEEHFNLISACALMRR